jgi:alanine racemase
LYYYAGAESIATIIELISKLKIRKIYQYLCKNELKPEIRHSACSAASIPATRMDMVRVGIILIWWPSPEVVFVNFLSTVKLILFKELLLGKAK